MPKRGRPKKGNIKKGEEIATALTTENQRNYEVEDPYDGLTDRQKTVARMKLRGLSQMQIAKFLDVSQPVISKEMKRVREHMQERGASVDQHRVTGETTSLYEEVEHKAWELYHTGENRDKAKALSLIMSAREKHTKLLMDLGHLERVNTTTNVEVDMSPLVKKWNEQQKQEAVESIVSTTLTALPEPEPPEAEDDIEDAYIIEDEDEYEN